MFWHKKLRKRKENQCFGTKNLENQRKTNVLAQQAQKTKGKPMLGRNKLRKPKELTPVFWRKKHRNLKENLCFGATSLENHGKTSILAQKAQNIYGKHVLFAQKACNNACNSKACKGNNCNSKACKIKACKKQSLQKQSLQNQRLQKQSFSQQQSLPQITVWGSCKAPKKGG